MKLFNHLRKLGLVSALVLTLGAVAQAATVYLKDGSQLRGTIVSATARDIQLHTPDGLLTISTDRISRIDYAESNAPVPQAQPIPQEQPAPPAVYAPEPVRVPRSYERTNQYFSVGFGMSAPLSRIDFTPTGGGTDTNGGPGLLISGQYLRNVDSRLSIGPTIEFSNRSAVDSRSLLPISHTDVSGNSILLLGTMKYSFIDHGYARPYFLGGVGAHRTSTVIESTPLRGFGWSDTDTAETRTLVDDSHWGFASTARVGIDFSLLDPAVFSLELGWTHLSGQSYTALPAGQDVGIENVTGNRNDLVLALKWGWRF